MPDAILSRILSECEAASRRGEQDFYQVWHRVVCGVRVRTSYIRPDVFEQAKAAWQRGASGEQPREGPQDAPTCGRGGEGPPH